MSRKLVLPTKLQVLTLYKTLIVEANKMLITGRKEWILYRIKKDFREQQRLTDEKMIIEYYRLGETHLDTIKVQVKHLNKPILEEMGKREPTIDEKSEKLQKPFDPFGECDDDDNIEQERIFDGPNVQLEYYSNTVPVNEATKE